MYIFCIAGTQAQQYKLSLLKSSANETGLKVARKFIVSSHGVYNAPNTKPHIPYFEVCTWIGALSFAELSSNEPLKQQLYNRFEILLEKDSSLLPYPDHVDYTVFGGLALEMYLQTNNRIYFDLGIRYADTQWAAPFGPRVTKESYEYYNKGYSWQTRLWIDDMYMITMVQAQAYRASKNKKFITRTADEMVMYLDKLQKPNGLFYHTPDVPMFWGRGN